MQERIPEFMRNLDLFNEHCPKNNFNQPDKWEILSILKILSSPDKTGVQNLLGANSRPELRSPKFIGLNKNKFDLIYLRLFVMHL